MDRSRRAFLSDVGRGVLVASLGPGLARELGLASAVAAEEPASLSFGALEPLVSMMQETPADRLLPALTARLNAGTDLKSLLAAGVLANARTFGGEDYVGFHTMMALGPAYRMAAELPPDRRALPVLKVLYRNTARLQEVGGRRAEVLRPLPADGGSTVETGGESLRAAVRRRDVQAAERALLKAAGASPADAFDHLLFAVQDNTEVHRVVLPYRAWSLVDLVGTEHAATLLRQSVRYCVKAESWPRSATWDEPRTLLPRLLEEHRLLGRAAGERQMEDAWVEQNGQAIFRASAADAAGIAAAALADGVSPAAIGEAISLAANQLVLRDHGRPPREEQPGKPVGSVHGDSIGVHASDSANAWRNMAAISRGRNIFACLILGAYQVALDRAARGGDFLNWQPLPYPEQLAHVKASDPAVLLREADAAIRGNLQAGAAAVAQRYGALGHPPRPLLDLLLRYAVSEDGSLHGEKYYRTVCEEFAALRPAFRWRQLVALARVTASEYGRPAPGYDEACGLLGVTGA